LPTGVVDMLADTGGRRGETVAVRWSNLQLDIRKGEGSLAVAHQLVLSKETGQIELRPPTRPRDRATIDLPPGTVAKLAQRRKEQAAERLALGAGWPGPRSPARSDGRRPLPHGDGRA
jgi:hypothetical protein